MFFQISNSVGSGKTQAVLEHIKQNLDAGYIIVTPTTALCTEIHHRLLRLMVRDPDPQPLYANGDSIRLVITDERLGRVFPRALEACRNFNVNIPPIVIVTEKTFQFLLSNLADDEKERFRVFVDEGLPPIETVQFSPGNVDEFLAYFVKDEKGFISPAPGQEEILTWVAHTPARLAARNLDHLAVPQFREICQLAVSDNYDLFLDTTEKAIRVVGILSPEPLRAFASVTLIVAIFEQTLLPLLWRDRHEIEFEAFRLGVDLYDTHKEQAKFVRIWHVLHADDNPSKINLRRNFETGVEEERDVTKQAIYRASQLIDAKFPDGVYCWSANNFFKNPDNVLSGERMPAICAGMNDFRRYTTVVSLLSMNPEPWVQAVMTKLFNFEDAKLFELWRFSHTYQVIGRCALRDRENERELNIVVLSRRCAEQLKGLFHEARIEGQLGDLPSLTGLGKAQRQKDQQKFPYTRADNSAYSKYKKRCEKNGDKVLEKIEWYDLVRRNRVGQVN